MRQALIKIVGTLLLAAVVWAVKAGLNAESQSYAQAGEATNEQGETGLMSRISLDNLPMPGFLSKNQIVKDLDLLPQDEQVFEACMTNYKRQKTSNFALSIAANEGCACTAKQASAQIPAEQLSLYMRIHAVSLNNEIMRRGDVSAAQVKQLDYQWRIVTRNLQKNSGLSAAKYKNVFARANKIQSFCASMNSYSPASIAQLASLRPMGHNAPVAVRTSKPKPKVKSNRQAPPKAEKVDFPMRGMAG